MGRRITTRMHDGALRLPEGILTPGQDEWWVERRDGVVVLIPRTADLSKLYIEPTTECPLDCRTCVRRAWQDPSARIDVETYRHLLAETRAMPHLKRMVFGGIGEPTCHPDLVEMIALARERGLAVTLSTNGQLLNGHLSGELIGLGLDRLVVSLDGADPDTYRDVRGAAMTGVLDNLRRLNETKGRLGSLLPSLEIEFVALRRNIGELGALAKLAGSLNASRVLVSHVLPHTEEMREERLYGREPAEPLRAASWHVKADAWVLWGMLDLPRMHWGAERRCPFVQDRAAVVGWDGGITPCYALSHNYSYYTVDGRLKRVTRHTFGNITEQSLLDIWTGEDYCRFRSEVASFRFPSCPDCDLRESCDLRARNEACWGCSPSCADCLYAQDIVRCPGAGR
jgi:tungsten cofactor oxidoreducase radical SAM maturase